MLTKLPKFFKGSKFQVCENFRKHNIFDPNYPANYPSTDSPHYRMDQFMLLSYSNFSSKIYYLFSFFSMAIFSRCRILSNIRFSFFYEPRENINMGWEKQVKNLLDFLRVPQDI